MNIVFISFLDQRETDVAAWGRSNGDDSKDEQEENLEMLIKVDSNDEQDEDP